MAIVYRGSCAACGSASAMFPHEWMSLRLRTGIIEPLHHPGEHEHLRELGFTWGEARREDRLLRFVAAACASCGTRMDIDAYDPRLSVLEGGPWARRLFIAGGVAFVGGAEVLVWMIGTETPWPWLSRLLMMPGAAVLAVLGYFKFVDRMDESFRKIARQLGRKPSLPPTGIQCAACASGQVYPVLNLAERSFPCPQCSAGEYRFVQAGRS
jgi:hypothetical protein